MERREFFKALIAGGAAVKQRPTKRNSRAHHKDTQLYHGPMAIPANIAAIIADSPAIKRTTHGHLVSRYSYGGATWLFRCQIPEHRLMVGEIIRVPDGQLRIHCWSAADPDRYTGADEPGAIIRAKEQKEECTLGYTEYAQATGR